MSKIYNEYLRLKEIDSNKLYLFKSGNFYIFVGEDCDFINNYIVLKKTKFSNETEKCGFPINSLEQYLRVFSNHKFYIEIIENIPIKNDKNENVTDIINKIDINNITPVEALIILNRIKELIK